ncbi:MAG TPA: tetratricopeptide repeat protein [Polyangiaceae bacterium]|nr:tetratricopeptide repeat protein [Polyangiaceae bacterium]
MSDSPKNLIDPNSVSGSLEQREAQARPLRDEARKALERGELELAMLRASDALMLLPNSRATLDLVDSIARGSSDPLTLVPLSVSVALTACRTRVLAMNHEVLDAIALLRHVIIAAPSLECMVWVRDWLSPSAIRQLGLRELLSPLVAFVKLWTELPLRLDPGDARYPNVRATADVLARVRAEFPAEAPLYVAELVLLRRLGDAQAALALARSAVGRFPEDWAVLVTVQNVERDAKNPDAALSYARRALQVLPRDGSPLHDAAWAYWEAKRPSDALALFEELLEEFPDYPLSADGRALVARLAAQN